MQHHELQGMTAPTLRALWRARRRIDAGVPRATRSPQMLFLHILQQPRGIVHEFRRMNQYGILGRYLPEFGRIVGQMQHDLFHVYTVDQHILMVVRNLRRFTMPEFAHEFPLCSRAHRATSSGTGCSTSPRSSTTSPRAAAATIRELGSSDARRFARAHGLVATRTPTGRVAGREPPRHVARAQKQDVYDPEVIRAFAERVGNERRLVALYLLTVADIRGTSPKVWNAWKAKLLEDLFRATRRALTGDAARARRRAGRKAGRGARGCCGSTRSPTGVKERLWTQLDTAYFLRHDAAGDRLAHAQPALPRRHRRARGQGAPRRRSAKACR